MTLKKITFNSTKKIITTKVGLFFLAFFVITFSSAQIQNNGLTYIGDNGFVYMQTNSYNFGTAPAQTVTSRTSLINGVLIFDSGTTYSGASNDHFVDGYVRTLGTSQFILPIGQSGIFAPAAVTPTSNTGVEGAYYNANPSLIGAALDNSIGTISTTEYWHIKSASANAKIALTWRVGSSIATLTGSDISKLVIVGWNGVKWVQLPSTVDATSILGGLSTVASGSITTDADVVLSAFSEFTFASKGDCSPIIASSGITKTWNGVWTPSSPTIADPVVINSAFSGNLSCNSLELNADITLADGQFVEIANGASGSSKIIMSTQASLVQRNSSASVPNILVTKQTRGLHAYDYVYLGSPVRPASNADADFFAQLATAQATTVATTEAFDLKYKWQAGTTYGWQTLGAMPEPGTGFIARVKPEAPFSSTTATDKINLTYTGSANNGDVTVTVAQNSAYPNGSSSHNLLANPYPSAIDGDMFLRLNTDIDGVLYVWQQATPPGTAQATSYSQADYLAFTRAGFVAPSSITGAFDGKIASGQGFKVKALTTGTVTFNNCMRLTGNNNSFFRTSTDFVNVVAPIDRFKLTMTGSNDVYSQILIAYTPNGTLNYDRMYDAGRNSTSTAQLYSLLDTDGRKLAINARPNFVNTDTVPLGVSKNNVNNEQFVINIEQKEGVFNEGQKVYLHDKDLNIYHNFDGGSYTFNSLSTALDSRFEVVYQATTLGNPNFTSNTALAILNENTFSAKATLEMETISIFDITGRSIAVYKVDSKLNFTAPFYHAEGVYIAKIKLTSGEYVTQKLINKK